MMALFGTAVILSGCVKNYVRSDIKRYAVKLTGHSNVTVSEGYREIQEDEEGYLDHLWTVRDDDSGVVFHVLDDYYWALEEVENRLLNDYDNSVFLSLLDNRKVPETKWLYLRTSSESGLVNAQITCSFTNGETLREVYEELRSVRKAAEDAGYPGLSVRYNVQYENPLRGAVQYEIDEGDTTGELGKVDEDSYARMRKNYLSCALDYRFEEALADFSPDEINEMVHAPESVRIYRRDGAEGRAGSDSSDSNQRDYLEGVIGNSKYAGISFGTLYELLRIEGKEVTGSPWHYSFLSPEGDRIEISYEFNDLSGFNDSEGRLKKGYYYMRNDRKVRMKAYYANHFDVSEIEELTGLRFAEDRPYITSEKDES